MIKQGNVVKEYKSENATVKICDDFYYKTDEEIQASLDRISDIVLRDYNAR